MRFAPVLLALSLAPTLAACNGSADVQRSAQARYNGHTLEEWWTRRRDPDDAMEREAQIAMHMMGATAVPFLAAKAASHDLGDVTGGSTALESLCPSAIPAMEAARAKRPSPALDAAIRRVRAEAADRMRAGLCAPNGDPLRPGSRGSQG